MVDYKKSKVYKITYTKDPGIFYIGSTAIKYLSRRLSVHKHEYTRRMNKFYEFIRNNGGWDNFKISLIKQYKLKTKDELLKKEQYYIKKLKPTLNHNDSINKNPKRKIYSKKYFEKNKVKVSIYNKKYHKRIFAVNRLKISSNKNDPELQKLYDNVIELNKLYYSI